MRKIALFGPPATGKSTLAKWLSAELGHPHTDLDEILFTPDGPLPLPEFRRQAGEITQADTWIVEGNFSKLADVVWHRADVLVWLDFPLPLIMYRIVRRSLYQLTGHDDSPQAQRLTWSKAFFNRRSLLRTAIRKYRNNRPRYAQQVSETAALGVEVVRLRTPRQVLRWRDEVLKGPAESHSRGATRHTTGPSPTAPCRRNADARQ
ncbi:adenylate kinase (plasmid) [Streptomyces hygroscopicus subsp. jinggangensis 5008]|nr:adenylate kinase [Streptomyces hygroscopicus subsp. jinggangensis 5008]AGF68543.1 adenylate kinase [Streptomyces hygroscopicus subsp. jinggangensis TL01]